MAADEIARALDEAAEQVFGGSVPWKEDAQRDKAIEVARRLQEENAKPEGALRLYQATLASPRDPGAAKRASVLFVVERMKATLGTLASGPDRVGFVRVLARAAAPGPNGAHVWLRLAKMLAKPRSQAVAVPLNALDRVATKVQPVVAQVERALSGWSPESIPAQPFPRSGNAGVWQPASVVSVVATVLLPGIRTLAHATDSAIGQVGAAIAALDATRSNHHAVLRQLVESVSSREADALWWSQALYSPSANAEYRDLATPTILPAMATDLIEVMGHEPDPSLTALYVETARRLIPGLDDRHAWAEWLERLLVPSVAALPEVYTRLARADSTGLPISAWLLSADDPVGAPEALVTGREVARRYFRERQLGAWIGEASK